jgi:hypothetical protein
MSEDLETVIAPALPLPDETYARMAIEHMNNVLRLFFNRLVSITNYLVGRNAVAFHSDVPGEIEDLDNKPLPVREDVLIIEDSEDSWAKKKLTIGNLLPVDVYVTTDIVIDPQYGDVGERVFICTNATPITLTLPPVTSEEVVVIRQNALVTIDTPDAATINGELTQRMPSRYDGVSLKGTTEGWIAA